MADNAGGLLADIDGAAGQKGGALPLEEGEDMCAEATGVSLRVNGTKIIKASRCVVTSYRILYAAPGEGTCKGLNLSDVAGVETKSASALGLFRMPKIVLTMEGGVVLQMSFHDSGMAAFKTALDTALRMALWRTRPAAATMEARHNSGVCRRANVYFPTPLVVVGWCSWVGVHARCRRRCCCCCCCCCFCCFCCCCCL